MPVDFVAQELLTMEHASFGLWLIAGLLLDSRAHDNGETESFFTPWHGVLYSGFAAADAGGCSCRI